MRTQKFFILLLTLFSLSSPAQEKCTVPIVGVTRTYITVKIGSITIPYILLDTGFAYDGLMLFNSSYRDSLDVSEAIEVNVGGAGNEEPSTAIMIDSVNLEIGTTKLVNHPVIIMTDYLGLRSNGIIGYSVFGHYATEIDYDNNTLSLYPPETINADSSWVALPLYFKENNIPWLDACVVIENETPVVLSMYIDFAAGDEILLLIRPDMKFSLPQKTKKVYLGRGLSGDVYGKTGFISKLIIGPYELNHIKASFADAKIRSKQSNADAILGNQSLKRFNIIFDYAHKKIYLKPNSHFNDDSH